MSIFMNGIDAKYVTMKQLGNVEIGDLCKMMSNCGVHPADAGEDFLGPVVASRKGLATIQMSGFVTLSCTGTIPTPGFCFLCADGNGGVMLAEDGGREYLVVEADSTNGTVGLFL